VPQVRDAVPDPLTNQGPPHPLHAPLSPALDVPGSHAYNSDDLQMLTLRVMQQGSPLHIILHLERPTFPRTCENPMELSVFLLRTRLSGPFQWSSSANLSDSLCPPTLSSLIFSQLEGEFLARSWSSSTPWKGAFLISPC